MNDYFKVRSVHLSRGANSVTLEPVVWYYEHPTETEREDGEDVPVTVDCDPDHEGAQPIELGGKMTELRFDSDPGYRPGDWITLSHHRTATDWAGN